MEAAGCYAAHDLHVLYLWLAAFADAQDPTEGPATVFGRAYANARSRGARRAAPRDAPDGQGALHLPQGRGDPARGRGRRARPSVDVVAWADADIELVAPLADARFLAFARAHDVATIHRYVVPSRADYPRDGDAAAASPRRATSAANRSQRAPPDTGFLTLALRGGAAAPALAFARAWSGYYATPFAARSRCLNDICVYDRVLFPTAGTAGATASPAARGGGGRAARRGAPAPAAGRAGGRRAAAAASKRRARGGRRRGAPAANRGGAAAGRRARRARPLGRGLARAGRRAVVEGCTRSAPQAWPAARAPPPAGAAAARAAGARGDAAGHGLREAIAARRVDLGRAHLAPRRDAADVAVPPLRRRCTPRAARTSATGARRTTGAVSGRAPPGLRRDAAVARSGRRPHRSTRAA